MFLFIGDRGQTSRTLLIFGIMLFYISLGVFYSAYGSSIKSFSDDPLINPTNEDFDYFYEDSEEDPDSRKGLINFFKNLKVGFKETPSFINLLIFVPIGILMIYLIIVAWINPGG